MKTIGNLTHSRTSEFQKAHFLNEAVIAFDILDSILGPDTWYPENASSEWTDVAVIDGKFYACYGEDSVMNTSDAKLIYIEIEPTDSMIKAYDYFKQY